MIDPGTLALLKKLEDNNNKTWFSDHKDEYGEHKKVFEDVIDDLSYAIAQFDDRVKDSLINEKRITKSFRVYRDVRFSKDKTPYKTNMSGFIAYDVANALSPAYYFSIQPGGRSMIGGGLWHPTPEVLKQIRLYVDSYPRQLAEVENDEGFRDVFATGLDQSDSLKSHPRGYSKEHEAIKYLKLKSFTVGTYITDKEVCDKGLHKRIVGVFEEVYKLNHFLQKALR